MTTRQQELSTRRFRTWPHGARPVGDVQKVSSRLDMSAAALGLDTRRRTLPRVNNTKMLVFLAEGVEVGRLTAG